MKYTTETLQERYRKGLKMKYIFFWGHQSSKDGVINKSCFSQWWPCLFEVDNVKYQNAEQYMMAEKARLFGDVEIRDKILLSNHPKHAKDLGRQVKGFQENIWESKCFEIVKRGNLEKFRQNKELLCFLRKTKTRILVEASPIDRIWGVGLSEDNKKITNPLEWEGKNLLGFALMEVRDVL